MKWKYLAAAASLVLLFSTSPVKSAIVNRIAAIVNDDLITTNQVEEKLAEVKDKLANLSERDLERARRQALNSLIEETLVNQRIKELKIKISDAEMDATIKDVQKNNGLSREQLEEALQKQGMTFEQYRENLRMELLRFRLLSMDVRKKIMITEQEILDYFRDHISEFRQEPFLRLGYLNFDIDNVLERDKIRAQVVDIQRQLRTGTGFDKILRAVAGERHVTGGSLGKVRVQDLSPIYADAVRDLPEGGVSEVLESPDALRLLYVEEKNPGEVRKFDEVRSKIEKKLTDQRMEERFKDWAENLKKEARIEILL